jgi:hypothetical protein
VTGSLFKMFFGFFYAAAFGMGTVNIEEMTFYGTADASAAIFLDADHVVVADDESNFLRVYHSDKPRKPLSDLDLSVFLKVDPDSPETDIEAAARSDDRIYWITSHGRNKTGKICPSRYRLFCTHIQKSGDPSAPSELIPVGTGCSTLVQQLLADLSTAQPILSRASQLDKVLSKKEQKQLAPKSEGLNIEGLAWHPGRKSLLIGLRNPLYTAPDRAQKKYAIVVELKNPVETVEKQKAAAFEGVLFWDLGGRAIRGMEYDPFDQTFFILAGPVDSESNFALYVWDGHFGSQPKLVHQWPKKDGGFKPEGIAVHPLRRELWVCSDDGTVEVAIDSPVQCIEGKLLDNGRCLNKHLVNNAQKTFRVRKLDLSKIKQDH